MDHGGDQDFPLPQVKAALDPYIRTREEALRIRRILTIYLQSHIEEPALSCHSPMVLTTPSVHAKVKKIPGELSGTRKAYLEALQSNIEAQNEYRSLASADWTTRDTRDSQTRPRNELEDHKGKSSEALDAYMALLEQRKRYEKLQILQDYLATLARKPPARAEYVDSTEMFKELSAPPALAEAVSMNRSSKATDHGDIESMMLRLQKAVIQTQNMVQREQRLLAEVRREREQAHQSREMRPRSRRTELEAFGRTRNALIEWIEGELAKTSETGEPPSSQTLPPKDHPSSNDSDITAHVAGIKQQYGRYVDARRDLLATMSGYRVSFPRMEPSAAPPRSQRHGASEGQRTGQAHVVLPCIERQLNPMARQQRWMMQQHSHVMASLDQERRRTEERLDRLADESHLLSSYPLLAEQPRFKHAAAIVRSKGMDGPGKAKSRGLTMRKVRGWTFAADAAGSDVKEHVREKMRVGQEHLGQAQSLIREVQSAMGKEQDRSGEAMASNIDDSGDVWAAQAEELTDETSQSGGMDNGGAWRGIRGTVGVLDGKEA
ncbi:MAG: hypothetical protein M1817_004977 [Caeruleum heppii]|nr:MAG: hypothetical protein M1817_004977 [Caeruleum heppii]